MLLYFSFLTLILTIPLTYFNYSINKNSIYLSGLLILLSISGLTHYFIIISNSQSGIAFFYTHFMPFLYLQGPFLYFYIKGTLTDKFTFNRKNLFHIVPALLAFLSVIKYYFKPWSYKIALAQQIIASPLAFLKNVQSGNPFINLPARTTLLLIYGIASIILLLKYCGKNKIRLNSLGKNQITLGWLFFLVIIIIVCAISYMIMITCFVIEEMPKRDLINQLYMNYITGVSFSLISISILFLPSVLYGIPIIITKKNELDFTKKESLETVSENHINNDLFVLSIELQNYLKTEKPFLNPKFSLDDLAKQLNVPKHHLYSCFNSILKVKFSELRKQMRVEYAKELLLNGDLEKVSLEGIWINSGFSSKTNFFVSFKEISGCTPIEFINNINLTGNYALNIKLNRYYD